MRFTTIGYAVGVLALILATLLPTAPTVYAAQSSTPMPIDGRAAQAGDLVTFDQGAEAFLAATGLTVVEGSLQVDPIHADLVVPPGVSTIGQFMGPDAGPTGQHCALLAFANPQEVRSVTLARAGVRNGGSTPSWLIEAFDAGGTLLAATGEGTVPDEGFLGFSSEIDEFTVGGSGIASLRLCSDNRVSTYGAVPLAGMRINAFAGPPAQGQPPQWQLPQGEVERFIQMGGVGDISPLSPGEHVVLAVGVTPAGRAKLMAYVGQLAQRPVRLSEGQWLLYVLDEQGILGVSREPISVPGFGDNGPVELVLVEGDPQQQRAAVRTLVHFALSSHLATLLTVSALAQARESGAIGESGYGVVDGMAQSLRRLQPDVLSAMDVLAASIPQPLASPAGRFEARSERLMMAVKSRMSRPTSRQVWSGITDSLFGFFTSDAMTGASARQDIQAITQDYSPQQREDLYQLVVQRGDVDAGSADEFFDRLGAGDYDHLARQLHQDFVAGNEDYTVDAASDGRRPIDTAARDGAVLVQDGAQFYADVIQTVLGARFGTSFDVSWDLATGISEYLADLDRALADPAGYAEEWELAQVGDSVEQIQGQVTEVIKNRILAALLEAGIPEEEAERLAEEIAGRVAGASENKLGAAATAMWNAVNAAAPPPAPSDPSQSEPFGVFVATLGTSQWALVGQQSVLEDTPSCSLRGWGLNCDATVRDVATLAMVLGPFATAAEARSAYCAAMVPGSAYVVPLTGGQHHKADFSFGTAIYISNAPSC